MQNCSDTGIIPCLFYVLLQHVVQAPADCRRQHCASRCTRLCLRRQAMALPRKRVDCLSDDECRLLEGYGAKESDEDGPACCGRPSVADRGVALASLMGSLRTLCSCAARKRQRAKEGHATSNCTTVVLEPILREQTLQHRQAWMDLHKLGQDRLLFTVMQGIHTESKCAAKGAAYENKCNYTLLGKLVCCDACRKLWGVCEHRFVLLRVQS